MKNQSFPPVKIFGAIVCLMVAAVIVGGIMQAGSPRASRAKTFDQRRADGLQQAASALDQYYAVNFTLPASLDELKNTDVIHYAYSSLVDPETGAPIEYAKVDDKHYQLCANFAFPSENDNGSGPYTKPMPAPGALGGDDMNWYNHPGGHDCRTGDAAARAPYQSCGAGSTWGSCPTGTVCTQLADRTGAICIKEGQQCQAAGCEPSSCMMNKSLPMQVVCSKNSAIEPDLSTPDDEVKPDRPVTCNLMKSSKTGKMACFGCGTKACVKPGPEWEAYDASGEMGIPYSCYSDDRGFCALAQ